MRTTAQNKKYKKRRHIVTTDDIVEDIHIVISQSKNGITSANEQDITMLYWQIGKLIRERLRTIRDRAQRSEIIEEIAEILRDAYGDVFTPSRVRLMVEFGNCFSDARAASLLAHNLTWQHLKHIIPLCGPLKRNFYVEMSRIERWSPEELAHQIREMLFERAVKSGDRAGKNATRVLNALKPDEASLSEFIYDEPDIIDM